MNAGERMRLTGAIALLRQAFRNDGAEGESVHLVCDAVETLIDESDDAKAEARELMDRAVLAERRLRDALGAK